jgi:arylsulfatase A-like enzyme
MVFELTIAYTMQNLHESIPSPKRFMRTLNGSSSSVLRLNIAGLMLLVGAQFISAKDAPRRSQPNIVFIMADDLGWGDLSLHGGTAPTPRLDQLAKAGLELTQHYVAPVCSPTRTGLLTGRCWSRFGVTSPQNERALPWDTVTLPKALKSVGYDSCLTGKWHLGSRPHEGPNQFGFDHSYGSLAGGVSPWNHRYKQGPFSETWHRNEALLEEPGHVTDLITDEAIGWLQSLGPSPFFLYVPYTAVHLPIKEPEAWLARVTVPVKSEVERHYLACVMHLDHSVGRLLDTIEQLGKKENTLIVFTSDNGASTAENNDLKYPDDQCPNGKLTGNNLPWRGGKGDLYEGGTRVPAIISWPGQIAPGTESTPVQIIDWMPTLTALAGFHPTDDLKWDGVDLSDLLLQRKLIAERSLYAVAPGWRVRSLRKGEWKLIAFDEQNNSRQELYHLTNDPREANNLAAAEPERLRELVDELKRVSARDKDAIVKRP